MDAIVIVMLTVQAGIFLATAYAILFGSPRGDRPRPVWSGLAIALVIVAGASIRIADGHAGEPGADLLMVGAPLLLGMGIMAVLLLIRQRREPGTP